MPVITASAEKGFTLIELVLVIIILAVLGIATTTYITSGVNLYTDVTVRDKSLNNIRFVMERLRREVGSALPNSAYIDDNACLVFTPIVATSLYSNFPISPLSGNSGEMLAIADYNFVAENADKAVVYLLDHSELTLGNKVHLIKNVNNTTMEFTSNVSFALDSPAKRVYIIRNNIRYCFSSNNLYRQVENAEIILMAENLSGHFQAINATLQRNALVRAVFNLNFDGQELSFEEAIHINNVP